FYNLFHSQLNPLAEDHATFRHEFETELILTDQIARKSKEKIMHSQERDKKPALKKNESQPESLQRGESSLSVASEALSLRGNSKKSSQENLSKGSEDRKEIDIPDPENRQNLKVSKFHPQAQTFANKSSLKEPGL